MTLSLQPKSQISGLSFGVILTLTALFSLALTFVFADTTFFLTAVLISVTVFLPLVFRPANTQP